MKTVQSFRRNLIIRYDRLVRALLVVVLGMSLHACDDPDDPQPEYGVAPLYGVITAVEETQKPA